MRAAFILFLALTMGLAACNGDDGDNGEATATEPTDGAPTVEDANGPPEVEAEPTVTESGLQIIDVKVGDGDTAEPGSTITFHYTGWLMDGTKFQSSLDTGEPITYALSGLIEGWKEGIPGMQEGGTRRLIIPPELAYGEAGSPPDIPPNAELIFDIELLEVVE